jgi:hypothetical protein
VTTATEAAAGLTAPAAPSARAACGEEADADTLRFGYGCEQCIVSGDFDSMLWASGELPADESVSDYTIEGVDEGCSGRRRRRRR